MDFVSSQQPVFNSLTNCLGPRKLLHSGKLYKAKSSKELYGFLFNDFLLLTYMVKQFVSSGSDKLFSPKSNSQFKMYKMVSESRCSMVVLVWWVLASDEECCSPTGITFLLSHGHVLTDNLHKWRWLSTQKKDRLLHLGLINTLIHFAGKGQK